MTEITLRRRLGFVVMVVVLFAVGTRDASAQPYTSQAAVKETPDNVAAVELVLDGNYAPAGSDNLDLGGGGALRAGYAIPFRWAAIVPEVGVDVFGFGGYHSAVVYGAFAGSRLRFGRGLQVGATAHLGVAGTNRYDGYAAPTGDVGLFTEVSFFDPLILGVQGEYKSMFAVDDRKTISWYTAGVLIGVRLH